jgi:hypothetical protein
MTDKESLQAIARGEKVPQPILRRLWWEGLIEVTEITDEKSQEREYFPAGMTLAGNRVLTRPDPVGNEES